MTKPSRELVLKKLRDCFPDEAAAREALSLLDRYTGDSDTGTARVQLAVLKECAGNLEKVRGLVELAKTDFRDVLAYAEYPGEFQASLSTPPDVMAAIRKRDREQYETWLLQSGGE